MRKLLLFLILVGSLLLLVPEMLNANGARWRVDCYSRQSRDLIIGMFAYDRDELMNNIQLCVHFYTGAPRVVRLPGSIIP